MGSKFLDLIDFNNNGLSDKGANVIVDFLVEHKTPVKKLKIYGNRLSSCEAFCRLLEDPSCGLQNEISLQELHLSHNTITISAFEDLLNTIAQCKRPEPMSPPLWLRIENNDFKQEDVSEVVERLQDQLQVCFAEGDDCSEKVCATGADVHIVL